MRDKAVYSVILDIKALEKDFKRVQAEDIRWYALVESFIENFEKEKEISKLLSVSDFKIEDRNPRFFKTIYKVDDNFSLETIFETKKITSEEYYDKLITMSPVSIDSKIRLEFKSNESVVSIEWLESNRFAALQITADETILKNEAERILRSLRSVKVSTALNMSIEEAFYQRIFHE